MRKRTPSQATLFGKTNEQIETEQMLEGRLKELRANIEEVDHILGGCEICLFNLVIDVERSGGTRTIWCVYIDDEIHYLRNWEPFEDAEAPRPEDYDLGSYGNSTEDTERFVNDRLKWARRQLKRDLELTEADFESLKDFKLF